MPKGFVRFLQLPLWLAPLVGAVAVAIGLAIKNAAYAHGFGNLLTYLAVCLVRESLAGYLLALPVLGLFYWLGLRNLWAFFLLAAVAVSPVAYFICTPSYSGLAPAQIPSPGTDWYGVLVYVTLAGITGLVFGGNVLRRAAVT